MKEKIFAAGRIYTYILIRHYGTTVLHCCAMRRAARALYLKTSSPKTRFTPYTYTRYRPRLEENIIYEIMVHKYQQNNGKYEICQTGKDSFSA